jgi:serine/threonine protein kinase
MAPEQGFDMQAVDIRVDVYSLGCTLYKLLTGRAPFSGANYATALQKLQAHAKERIPPIRDLRPEVPLELSGVLESLLAKSPADRFSTPDEVAHALEPFTVGQDLVRLMAVGTGERLEKVETGSGEGQPAGRAGSAKPTVDHWPGTKTP